MNLTALEYIQKEFDDIDKITPKMWLRKMQEYAVLKNSAIDLEHILNLPKNQKKAVAVASEAVYFSDNSDYKNALYSILSVLTNIPMNDLEDDVVKAIFHLLAEP